MGAASGLRQVRTRRSTVFPVDHGGRLAYDDANRTPGGAELRSELSTLALFDVLGFSDRLAAMGLPRIYAIYRELADLLDGMKEPGAFGFWVPTDFDGNVEAQYEKAARGEGSRWAPAASVNGNPGVAYFSDTIMLWMPYDPVRCGAFVDLSIHFFCRALNLGMPLRGALAIGDLHMDPSRGIFLGRPIIEGARAEAAQSWCGYSLGPSFRRYPCIVPADRFRDYTDHIKPGREEAVLPIGVDWTWHWRDTFPATSLASLAAAFRRKPDDPYWTATLSFAEASAAAKPTGLKVHTMG